jgi:hypothetical protein
MTAKLLSTVASGTLTHGTVPHIAGMASRPSATCGCTCYRLSAPGQMQSIKAAELRTLYARLLVSGR